MRLILFIFLVLCFGANAQIIRANPYYRPFAVAAPAPFVGLLDSYPGAAAGYSLRKLDTNYTGAAIRIRESGGNTETDINFLSSGELDTSAIKTHCGSNSGFIVSWYDQSGNSRTAGQSTAANQPRICNSGVIERVNGKPAINFGTESNEWFLTLPTGFLNAQTALTWLAVLKIKDFTSSNAAVFGPSTTFSTGLEILQALVNGAGRRTTLRVNNTVRNTGNTASDQLWPDDTQCLTEVYGDATAVSAWRNNTSVNLSNTAALPSLNFNGVYAIGTYVNSTFDISGSIQEMVIYYSTQSSSRSGIASNINTFYSIY